MSEMFYGAKMYYVQANGHTKILKSQLNAIYLDSFEWKWQGNWEIEKKKKTVKDLMDFFKYEKLINFQILFLTIVQKQLSIT